MGKRKILIEKLEDPNKRQVTFSKRRKGLFQKAADVCMLCQAQIAVIVFSPAGKPYTFGHSSVDSVVNRYLANTSSSVTVITNEEQSLQLLANMKELEWERKKEREMKQGNDGHGFWWESIDIEEFQCLENSLKNGLETLKHNVMTRTEELSTCYSKSDNYSYTESNANSHHFFLYGSSSETSIDHDMGISLKDDFKTPLFLPAPVSSTVLNNDHIVHQNVAREERGEEDYSWPSEDEWAALLDDDICLLPPL